MLNILKQTIQQLLDDIDAGNSNLPESDQEKVIDFIKEITTKELNKTQSADYIGVCKSTFDNYVRKGLIPQGHKKRGTNVLSWNKCDLDKFLNDKHI